MVNFDYVRPTSLSEALAHLTKGGVKPLAGGTDLLPQIKEGRHSPSVVIDVKTIPELNLLEFHPKQGLRLGAAVPCAAIIEHPAVKEHYPLLGQVCALIGSQQIQNRASVGGNLCNAAPSADTAAALLCLEARVSIASSQGQREVAMEDFFLGPGKTILSPQELLMEIRLPPPPPNSAGHYLRLTPREAMDIAVAGVASFLVLDKAGKVCQKARIALIAVAPTPKRVLRAEAALEGRTLTKADLLAASLKAAEESQPIDDHRGSALYRRHIVQVLTQRTLEACLKSLGREIK